MMFQELEGDVVIVQSKGVYKQVPLYTRNGDLYAKISGGFIRLNQDGSTTQSQTRIDTLITEQPLYQDTFGRLTLRQTAKALTDNVKQKLLGNG